MKIVFILRGLPGSGKSTFAEHLVVDGGVIHSTDDFFVSEDGEYCFDPDRLNEFHSLNFLQFKNSLKSGVPFVVVDNTNSRRREWIHYLLTAESFGYTVMILNMPHPDPEVAAKRNIHGVPAEAIRAMLSRWEN